MAQKVFGIREAKNGTETDELLENGSKLGTKRERQNVEEDPSPGGWWCPGKGGKKLVH